MAFDHKPLFINKYNKIIEAAQKSIIELEINEFKMDIDSLNNDVRVHCSILEHHITDLERVKTEIYDYQKNILKSDFNSSSIKVTKATIEPYYISKSSNSKQKSNKQFDNSRKDIKNTSPNSCNQTAAKKPNQQRAKSRDIDNSKHSNNNRNVNFFKKSNGFNNVPLLNTYPNSYNFSRTNNENPTKNQTPLPQRTNNSNQYFQHRSTNHLKN